MLRRDPSAIQRPSPGNVRTTPNFACTYVAQAVEVEVDTDTGFVRLVRVVSADDVRQAINPQLVAGQIEGAIAQAQGYALMENFQMKDGSAQTQRFHDGAGYDPTPVREQVAALAQQYGGPALDVGTGACACMAVAMARQGLWVTAVDHVSSAVRIAQERAAADLSDLLDVHYAEATRLPFPNGAYRVVTAFDALCHAPEPAGVVTEMFRLCADHGAVIVTELNSDGRQVTRHHDGGFETRLPDLLAEHCQNCQRFDHPHHVTFVCGRLSVE